MTTPINLNNINLYRAGGIIQNISKELKHRPYCLVLCPNDTEMAKAVRGRVARAAAGLERGMAPWVQDMIAEISKEIEVYDSFTNPGKKWRVFRIYAKESKNVPIISDEVFFKLGIPTAEHDIPYYQRVLADLAAQEKLWMYDTGGWKEKLKVLVYDIETTKLSEEVVEDVKGKFRNIPIDIIGYSKFELSFESSVDLGKEEFNIELTETTTDWQAPEVVQLVVPDGSEDTEFENLKQFTRQVREADVVGGHNILSFDNMAVRDRLEELVNRRRMEMSVQERTELITFLRDYTKPSQMHNFGRMQWTMDMYPTSFDTYYAARRFYSFLPSFGLKEVAPALGVQIKDRMRVDYTRMDPKDPKTLLYNKHDVQEQLGITMILLQQALPLAFVTCLPFEDIWPTGTTRLWDHMAMIRAAKYKKVFQPIYSATKVAREAIGAGFGYFRTREELTKYALETGKERWSDVFKRVVKYGQEMPEWIEYAHLIQERLRPLADMPEEDLDEGEDEASYHVPGGLTLHPDDPKVKSDLVVYWSIVNADVGAMYPTILQSKNVGADTITLCDGWDEPDDWVWFKKVPDSFLHSEHVKFRKPGVEEGYADGEGIMIGIKVAKTPSMVSYAMTGVLKVVGKTKKRMKIFDKDPNATENEKFQQKMVYASLKALRNAGTHGIVSAESVSAREFNILAGSRVTTTGQLIIQEVMERLRGAGARIITTDTDGVYVACARGCMPDSQMFQLLGADKRAKESLISNPADIKRLVGESTEYWRKALAYPDFELEVEDIEAGLFIKHKNYLYWEVGKDKVKMTAKGNTFKGSDKPNVARKALNLIMTEVLKDFVEPWVTEDEARKRLRESIVRHTEELVKKLDLKQFGRDDLVLVQMVQPPLNYKKTGKARSESKLAIRAKAVERLIGKELVTGVRMRFMVCKDRLPGLLEDKKKSKPDVKPAPYMWPIDCIDEKQQDNMVDLEWYRTMLKAYVYGAFGWHEEKSIDRAQLKLLSWS